MSASLLGLGALVLASALAFTVLKWIGAIYLVWLGIQLFRSAPKAGLQQLPEVGSLPAKGVFWHACAITALNPKSIAFFIAFVPQFLRPEAALLPQMSILIATFVSLAAVNALAYAFLADRLRVQIKRPGFMRFLTRAGGTALIGMGLATATLRRATA